MLRIIVNGEVCEALPGSTILQALHLRSIHVPALCHDPRIAPIGGCRLCIVHVEGCPRPVTACNTVVTDGMRIETHSEEILGLRRTNLKLLAGSYPQANPKDYVHNYFAQALDDYKVAPAFVRDNLSQLDDSHPYIHVDMSRCIYCYRCVRICEELQGQFVWRIWNRGDATSIKPDSGTTLAESSCVSCGACVDTCPSGALEDKKVLQIGAPTKWATTTCPYCGVGCEMNVGTVNGRIVSVRPSMEAPVNKGHLCVKGRYAFEFVRSTDRVTDPMLRRNGEWQKVSWDEAIKVVADNFSFVLQRHGPDALAVLGSARATNEENYLAQKFARLVLRTNNVDCCARVCHSPSAAALKKMFGTGAATNSFNDIERAKAILLCGSNATENHPIVGARIKQAKLHGAKLIVIDPRKIELAAYADIHLQLRAGTNVPLLNAMAYTIVEEQLFDAAAIEQRVSGWESFKDFASRWRPETVASRCGVSAEAIREAARLYAFNKPSICFHGLGVTEHTQGTEGVMCLANLSLLTGNFGKPGTGVNPLRGQNNVQGSAHMGCEPHNLTGYVPLAQNRERFEAIWRKPIPTNPGLNLIEMIEAANAGGLKAMWAIGYDIALTDPDARETERALDKLEFLVVQDMFFNEVAKRAHVFLPVTSSFEKDGTFMNSERRLQRVRKVLEPPGNSKADWEVICAVAQAMGYGENFSFYTPEDIWNEIRKVWVAGRGITYHRLDHHGLQWPCPSEDHPGTEILHVETFAGSPRAELQRVEYRPTPEIDGEEYPFVLITGRTLYQFNAGTMTMHTEDVELRSKDLLDVSPEDASRLGFRDGDIAEVTSRYGTAFLTVQVNPAVKRGEVFSTFHTPQTFINRVTSPFRDKYVDTPEYKVTAVRLQKSAQPVNQK